MEEILVLGGGPAGCVTALHLCRMGYAVTLVTQRRHNSVVEGLSARVVDGLRNAGCGHAVACIGEPVARMATWNGVQSDANREYVIDRSTFDAAMLEDARAGGVAVVDGKVTGTAGCRVQVALAEGGTRKFRVRFLVEARGRRAPRAKSIELRGPPALSLSQPYKGCPQEAVRTRVASFPGGWSWIAGTGKGTATLQVIVAAEDSAVTGINDLRAEFEQAQVWLGLNAIPAGPVTVRDATGFLHRSPIDEHSIRVGDAAFGMDPLSGHGIFEAVGSAMAAAAVVNTVIARPGNAAKAREYYEGRVRDAFMQHARVGRDFYRTEQRWMDQLFWRTRRDWPDDEPAHGSQFDARACIRRIAVIEDRFIVRRDVVVTPNYPRGVRFIDGVPLADLIDRIDHSKDTPGEADTSAVNWLRQQGIVGTDGSLIRSAAQLRDNGTAR